MYNAIMDIRTSHESAYSDPEITLIIGAHYRIVKKG